MSLHSRYRNSILLSAIGDALGWITEFEKSQEGIYSKYGVRTIESFYDWEKNVGGRFNGYLDKISAGSYSDDTQLLLSVARSINSNGEIDNIYFSKTELPFWLHYARGAGRTIKNAANKIKRKSATWNSNYFKFKAGRHLVDYRECGANGAAMRILPIALANYNNPDKIKENIFSNSIITHGHPRAIVGAILYGIAINEMLGQAKANFSYETYLTKIGKDIENKFKLEFIHKSQFLSWVNEWNKNNDLDFFTVYNETVKEVLNLLRECYINIKTNIEPKQALSGFGCYSSATKGSGISTVIGGIYFASKYYLDPINAILKAVNSLGTDTDSIAAFTGGLIGANHEEDVVPDQWMVVQDAAYLDSIAKNLHLISSSNAHVARNNFPIQHTKSLNEILSDCYIQDEKVYFDPLGKGKIIQIERQKTITRGRYNLILDVAFEIGQTCRFSKLLKIEKGNTLIP